MTDDGGLDQGNVDRRGDVVRLRSFGGGVVKT